jgi:threonine aldolase
MGWVFYEFIGPGIARLMCSWATTEADVDRLLEDVRTLTIAKHAVPGSTV